MGGVPCQHERHQPEPALLARPAHAGRNKVWGICTTSCRRGAPTAGFGLRAGSSVHGVLIDIDERAESGNVTRVC